MTTKHSIIAGLAALVVAVALFGSGYATGNHAASHPTVLVGDGDVGADQATLQVGDTYYGFRSSVSWTDSAGSFHDQGWPACLPRLQAVTGVRFEGATLWAGNVGFTSVVWVDCQAQTS